MTDEQQQPSPRPDAITVRQATSASFEIVPLAEYRQLIAERDQFRAAAAKFAARLGRRLCAHADRDGEGMHWLEPGETCLVAGNGTCEANARKGTGTGMCDRPLDVHGLCDRAADHVDGSTGCGA